MATIEFRAMNTVVILSGRDNQYVPAGLSAAKEFIARCEGRFSRFIPESELCHLNSSAGKWVSVSTELMEILTLARHFYRDTGGLFDPSILPELIRAGYDKSMDQIVGNLGSWRAVGTPSPQPRAMGKSRGLEPRAGFSQINLDTQGVRARLPSGTAIDLGGIAKGWIVEQAATLLSSFSTPCAVSAGGDMFFVGVPDDGLGWQVELEDPRAIQIERLPGFEPAQERLSRPP